MLCNRTRKPYFFTGQDPQGRNKGIRHRRSLSHGRRCRICRRHYVRCHGRYPNRRADPEESERPLNAAFCNAANCINQIPRPLFLHCKNITILQNSPFSSVHFTQKSTNFIKVLLQFALYCAILFTNLRHCFVSWRRRERDINFFIGTVFEMAVSLAVTFLFLCQDTSARPKLYEALK